MNSEPVDRPRGRRRRAALVAVSVLAVLAMAAIAGASRAAAQGAGPVAPVSTTPTTGSVLAPGVAVAPPALPDWAEGELPANPCGPDGGGTAPAGSIVPDYCWGRFPSSHYDIGFDEGAWNHISRKVYGTFTDLAFSGARSATALALWLVQWACGFAVFDRLGASAVDIARRYNADVVGPLGLANLAWFYTVAWAAVAALRGKLTMAAGELATSIMAAGLAGVILANPAGYLRGTFDTMGTLSGALLATGTGQPPPRNGNDAKAVLGPLQGQIHEAFVEQPYDYLSWGGPLPPACAAARDRILATGPHGADNEPRAVMEAAGCKTEATFNHDPTGTRLFGAVLTFVAAATMVVLLGLVAATVVVAQMVVIVLFAIAPFALLAAVLAGSGRELAWRWVAGLARAVLAVVGMSVVLSLLLLSVTAVLGASGDLGLVERFALVNMVVVAMLVARKRVLAAGHGLAGALGQRLATRRPGGERTAPWLPAAAVGGASGFAVGAGLGPDRSGRTTRLASAGGRNYLANRRVSRSQHAADARAERRSAAVVARQRTELGVDGDGRPVSRTTLSVDGPAATTRRARAARDRVERRAAGHVVTSRRRPTGWAPSAPAAASTEPEHEADLDADLGADVEEA